MSSNNDSTASQGQEQRAARAPRVLVAVETDARCDGGGGYHYGCSCYTPDDDSHAEREAEVASLLAEVERREAQLSEIRRDAYCSGWVPGNCTLAEWLQRQAKRHEERGEELRVARETAVRGWLVWSNEHVAWWAPESMGYRARVDEAGRYTLAQAREICRSANVGCRGAPSEIMVPSPELVTILVTSAQSSGEPRRDDDPVHTVPRLRCEGCSDYLDADEVDGIGGHCRAEDDGKGNPVPVHCGPVTPEPADYSADVHDANEHAPAGGGATHDALDMATGQGRR